MVKGFINYTLDREIDLDIQSMWNLGFVEEGPSLSVRWRNRCGRGKRERVERV